MERLSVSELRAHLADVIRRVSRSGEDVEITQHGEVKAVLVHPSRVRRLPDSPAMRAAEDLGRQLRRARDREPLPGALELARAEEIVAAVRTGRNERH